MIIPQYYDWYFFKKLYQYNYMNLCSYNKSINARLSLLKLWNNHFNQKFDQDAVYSDDILITICEYNNQFIEYNDKNKMNMKNIITNLKNEIKHKEYFDYTNLVENSSFQQNNNEQITSTEKKSKKSKKSKKLKEYKYDYEYNTFLKQMKHPRILEDYEFADYCNKNTKTFYSLIFEIMKINNKNLETKIRAQNKYDMIKEAPYNPIFKSIYKNTSNHFFEKMLDWYIEFRDTGENFVEYLIDFLNNYIKFKK